MAMKSEGDKGMPTVARTAKERERGRVCERQSIATTNTARQVLVRTPARTAQCQHSTVPTNTPYMHVPVTDKHNAEFRIELFEQKKVLQLFGGHIFTSKEGAQGAYDRSIHRTPPTRAGVPRSCKETYTRMKPNKEIYPNKLTGCERKKNHTARVSTYYASLVSQRPVMYLRAQWSSVRPCSSEWNA